MSYKVAPLTVNPKQKSALTSKAFVSQPSAEEELLVGRLFVLMEIDQSRSEDFAVADFIVKEIYKHYYENEQFFLRDKIANLKIDYIFEAALTKLNRGIAEFLELQKISLRPGSLNIVIGVLHKNRLLFAHTGANKAMLLYRPKAKANGLLLDYNLLDISEKTQDPTQELASQQKLFANVVNGVIPSQGYFFFANEAVMEYLSKKQLLDIITTLPPASAAEQIKLILEQTDAFVPFFALIVKNTTGEEYATVPSQSPEPAAVLGGQTSVERLNLTQEKTEQLLSPSGLLTIKKWFNKLQPQTSTIKNFAQDKARQLNLATSRLNSKRSSWNLGKKTIEILGIIFSVIIDGFRSLYSWVANPEARQKALASLRNLFKKTAFIIISLPARFSRLTLKNKVLLSVLALCLIGFIGSLAYTGITYRQKASQAKIAEAQTQFEQKEHQLEASLLYGNTEGARTLVADMENILKGLPNKTESEKNALADLTKRYHVRLDALYAITRLDNPAVFAALPAAANSLALAGGSLYAARGESKNVYTIDSNGQVATLTNDAFSGKSISVSADENGAYFWDGSELFTYAANDKIFRKATIENRPATIDGIGIYNTRLYAVALGEKTVYRFNQDKKTFSFSNRMAWSKDDIGLSSVNAVSIDGRIYLTGDKQIKRFSGGNINPITLEATTPALEEPTLAIASPDLDYLYVLEPSKRRLIVYDDDGKYLAQYTSDSFDALSGLALDEANKKIYLLSGQTLYRIDAVHIAK